MVLEARLRVRHVGCFTEHVTNGEHVTQIAGDRSTSISVVHASSEARVDAILEQMTATAVRVSVVERNPGAAIVRMQCRADGVAATILGFGCTITWPAVYAGGTELFTVVAPNRERLEALVDALRDLGDVKLERLSEVPADALDVLVPLGHVTSTLTERQLTVLQRAIEHGYYESPRRASAEALAASFGVSRSTFQEHLRKAEARILEGFAATLAAHPALLKGATRKPGRPASRLTIPGNGR